jgi:hypothetical protein
MIDQLVSLLQRIVVSSRRPDVTLAVVAGALAWFAVSLLKFIVS